MSCPRLWIVLSILVLMIGVPPAMANTYYVGSCAGGSFGTISAAIGSPNVAPGSVIKICPGTYAEQLVINKALTLQGVSAFNSSEVVITIPSSGLTPTPAIFLGGTTVAPQILVTAAPVKLTGLTVDGTLPSGGTCPQWE